MGSAIGTAVEKAGAVLGNTITAPFSNIFSQSCEDECGEWDGVCFLQNACGASLLRLFKASFLGIITVLFLYLVLWETGLVKCIVKKSCKLSWKAFWGSFRALCGACGFVCHRVRDTRRVYRGHRRRDLEVGGTRLERQRGRERELQRIEQQEEGEVAAVGAREEEGQAAAVPAPESTDKQANLQDRAPSEEKPEPSPPPPSVPG